MRKFIVFLIIIIAIGGLIFGYYTCTEHQQEKIKMLESKIALLKETHTPIRFKIIEKTDDSIKLSAKFYNANDEEVNKLETTLAGQELSFDFYIVPIKDRYIAFPSKIFTNKIAAANGIEIYNLYDKEGFPLVFETKDMDTEIHEGLKDLFRQVKTGQLDSLNNYFGNMVHDIKEFKSFIPQTVYSIVTHTKGGIEIIEE
jgi:hypothetical protein